MPRRVNVKNAPDPLIAIRGFRRRKRWLWLGGLSLLVLLGVADRRGLLLVRQSDDLKAYHGRQATVERVIDGDTIEIDIPDPLNRQPVTRVCLWGVNCPEVGRFGKPSQAFADEATEFTKSLVEHQSVLLRLESQRPRDTFGRILAHVDLPGGRCLNQELLQAGLARADDRWPHMMITRYAQIEYAAKRKGIGMWQKK